MAAEVNDDTGRLLRRPMNRQPTVSIGVPVHNGEDYIGEMLDSLSAQTYTDYEVIVSDNGSTDSTVEIVRQYAERDPRIKLITHAENMGAGPNFNHVLTRATGTFFKWQAHDDTIEPTFLARCVDMLEGDPELTVAYTGVKMVDRDGELIEEYGIVLDVHGPDPVVRFREMLLRWHLCYEVFGLIRMDALDRTRGMGEFSHGDGVLLAHLALLGPLGRIEEPLFSSRQHPGQSMAQFGYEGGGNDYHAYAVWFDPTLQGKLVMPAWRIIYNYLRVIRDSKHLSVSVRTRCLWILVRRMGQHARHLAGDIYHAGLFAWTRVRRRSSS